jgi:hypothetical protein
MEAHEVQQHAWLYGAKVLKSLILLVDILVGKNTLTLVWQNR